MHCPIRRVRNGVQAQQAAAATVATATTTTTVEDAQPVSTSSLTFQRKNSLVRIGIERGRHHRLCTFQQQRGHESRRADRAGCDRSVRDRPSALRPVGDWPLDGERFERRSLQHHRRGCYS